MPRRTRPRGNPNSKRNRSLKYYGGGQKRVKKRNLKSSQKCPRPPYKVMYKTKKEAREALGYYWITARQSKIPTRYYPCEHCNGYHLTSRPYKND